MKHIHINI